jgi:hypothetical protein
MELRWPRTFMDFKKRKGAETAADKTHFHADGTFLIVQCPVLW